MKNGLFKVRLLNKEGKTSGSNGPLLDNMVVSKRVLGTVVRQTAVFAHRSLSQDSGPVGPMRRRKQKIDAIAKEFSPKQQPFNEFLSQLFFKKGEARV